MLMGVQQKMKITKLVIGLFFLCAVALAACGIDVGSNDDQFFVSVKNNTSETVTLGECNDACGPITDTWVMRPGGSASTGQDPDGVFRPMEVFSRTKKVIGCMPFKFSKVLPTSRVVDISQMVQCGKSAGEQAAHGRDWPFSYY